MIRHGLADLASPSVWINKTMDSPGRTRNIYSGDSLCFTQMSRETNLPAFLSAQELMVDKLSSTKDSYGLVVAEGLLKRRFGCDIILQSVL